MLRVGEASTALPAHRCLTVKQGEMMIAVLIDARMPGSSGWVAVRHARKIKVRGMEEDSCVTMHLDGDGLLNGNFRTFYSDTDFPMPDGVERVRGEILKVGEGSRISIDLE